MPFLPTPSNRAMRIPSSATGSSANTSTDVFRSPKQRTAALLGTWRGRTTTPGAIEMKKQREVADMDGRDCRTNEVLRRREYPKVDPRRRYTRRYDVEVAFKSSPWPMSSTTRSRGIYR